MINAANAEGLYRQLSHLIANTPDLDAEGKRPLFSQDAERWMARVYAAVKEVGEIVDANHLRGHFIQLRDSQKSMRDWATQQINAILYRAWAIAEAAAPASAQGTFIPAGAAFDAFAAIGRIFGHATKSLLVVDPYMDEKTLTDFLPMVPDGVLIQLLADSVAVKSSLKPAAQRWSAQYGAARPLEAQLSPARTLHDRLIIVDAMKAWILTQSLSAFANRAPGSIELAGPESTMLKLTAYADIWNNASII